jgi:SAM-dependent methyltransferase
MRAAVRDVFAVAASGYGRGNPLLSVERPETTALLPPLAGRTVLDLGAGLGYYAALSAAQGARVSLALDVTYRMIARAPRPAVVADAVRLPLRARSVDVIIAALLMSFVESRRQLFAESARVLRPGGVLVLSDLHAEANRQGWSRSFRGGLGERLVIEARPAEAALVVVELEAVGFRVDERREPLIDERLEPEFDRAGRRDFQMLRGTPLLCVLRARKEGKDVR